MNERFDPYAILGLSPQASQAQVNHAYRGLLRRLHPDTRSLKDESLRESVDAALQQVLAAYALLSDPGRRAEHDARCGDHDARSSRPRAGRSQQMPHGGSVPSSTPVCAPVPPIRFPAPVPPIRVGPVRWHTHRNT